MTDQTTPEIPIDAPTEERLAAAVAQFTEEGVVRRSIELIGGYNAGDEFLLYVGGRHAQGLLNGAPPLYWPELWGTRALLYVWDDSASDAVNASLRNQAWRVREMGARVTAARVLPFAQALVELLTDEVARVRASAARALGAVGGAEHLESLKPLLKDPEIDVRRGAQQGLDALRARLG